MLTVKVNPQVTLTGDKSVRSFHKEQIRLRQEEESRLQQEQWRRETYAWLHDPANIDCEEYSDVYKEYFGHRPIME